MFPVAWRSEEVNKRAMSDTTGDVMKKPTRQASHDITGDVMSPTRQALNDITGDVMKRPTRQTVNDTKGDASTTTADSAAAQSAIDGACVWHGLYVRVGEVKHNGLVRGYANGHNVHHAKAKCGGGCRLYVWAVWHGMYVRVGEVDNKPVCDCRVTDPPRRPRKLFVNCEWSSVPTQTHTRSEAATCWSHKRTHAVRRRRVGHTNAHTQ
jgi:hypothetical protein